MISVIHYFFALTHALMKFLSLRSRSRKLALHCSILICVSQFDLNCKEKLIQSFFFIFQFRKEGRHADNLLAFLRKPRKVFNTEVFFVFQQMLDLDMHFKCHNVLRTQVSILYVIPKTFCSQQLRKLGRVYLSVVLFEMIVCSRYFRVN